MPDYRALTLKASQGGLLNCLISDVKVCYAFDGDASSHLANMLSLKGIWDTGATGSAITPDVVKRLDLKPVGMTRVSTANGTADQNQYLVNLMLPNGVGVRAVKVTEADLTGADVLIGMDVITLGDFSITNFNRNTVMSFRVPSCYEVDFVPAVADPSALSRAERRRIKRQDNRHSK